MAANAKGAFRANLGTNDALPRRVSLENRAQLDSIAIYQNSSVTFQESARTWDRRENRVHQSHASADCSVTKERAKDPQDGENCAGQGDLVSLTSLANPARKNATTILVWKTNHALLDLDVHGASIAKELASHPSNLEREAAT